MFPFLIRLNMQAMVLPDLESYQRKKGDYDSRQSFFKATVIDLQNGFYRRSHLELKGIFNNKLSWKILSNYQETTHMRKGCLSRGFIWDFFQIFQNSLRNFAWENLRSKVSVQLFQRFMYSLFKVKKFSILSVLSF